jgi:hypothetical protein
MKKNSSTKRYSKKYNWGDNVVVLKLVLFIIIGLGVVLTVWYMNKPHSSLGMRTKAAAVSKYSIYYDGLAQGWLEWSDANVDPRESRPVYSGSHSISYRSRKVNSPLYFHTRTPINTSTFTTLHFALYSKQEGVKYAVSLEGEDEKKLAPLASLENFGGQPVLNQWKVYEIPLIFLNAQNKDIYGIYIQSIDSRQQTIFIDEIDLRGPGGDEGGNMTPTPTLVVTRPQVSETSVPTVRPSSVPPTATRVPTTRPTAAPTIHPNHAPLRTIVDKTMNRLET